jgi:hypothetical protein
VAVVGVAVAVAAAIVVAAVAVVAAAPAAPPHLLLASAGVAPLAVLQPLDWHHQHVVGPVQAIGPVQTAARLLRCTAGGATVHTSSGTSTSSSRSATSVVVLDAVVREVGSSIPRRLLQHHGAHYPHTHH